MGICAATGCVLPTGTWDDQICAELPVPVAAKAWDVPASLGDAETATFAREFGCRGFPGPSGPTAC
jgi:hypothetical protein